MHARLAELPGLLNRAQCNDFLARITASIATFSSCCFLFSPVWGISDRKGALLAQSALLQG